MTYTFELTEKQQILFEKWKKEQKEKDDFPATIGGRFGFIFIETSIGLITKAKDFLLDNEIDLTDYEYW